MKSRRLHINVLFVSNYKFIITVKNNLTIILIIKWSVFLLYALITGEVFDYLVAHGRMKEKEARAKFRQV